MNFCINLIELRVFPATIAVIKTEGEFMCGIFYSWQFVHTTCSEQEVGLCDLTCVQTPLPPLRKSRRRVFFEGRGFSLGEGGLSQAMCDLT